MFKNLTLFRLTDKDFQYIFAARFLKIKKYGTSK